MYQTEDFDSNEALKSTVSPELRKMLEDFGMEQAKRVFEALCLERYYSGASEEPDEEECRALTKQAQNRFRKDVMHPFFGEEGSCTGDEIVRRLALVNEKNLEYCLNIIREAREKSQQQG